MTAASKRSIPSRTPQEDLATRIDIQAARLAGVEEILEQISEASGVANSLGVLRDTVGHVNEMISNIADDLRSGTAWRK